MSDEFTDLVVDEVPLTTPELDAVEYPCTVCGKESGPYSGRGRKPTKCSEHKVAKGGRAKTTGKNATLAAQATDTLAQCNELVAFVALVARYENTSEQIKLANTVFRESAYSALLTDPDLCQTIIRTGGITGKGALIISYAMLASAVVPTAIVEFKMHRAEREID